MPRALHPRSQLVALGVGLTALLSADAAIAQTTTSPTGAVADKSYVGGSSGGSGGIRGQGRGGFGPHSLPHGGALNRAFETYLRRVGTRDRVANVLDRRIGKSTGLYEFLVDEVRGRGLLSASDLSEALRATVGLQPGAPGFHGVDEHGFTEGAFLVRENQALMEDWILSRLQPLAPPGIELVKPDRFNRFVLGRLSCETVRSTLESLRLYLPPRRLSQWGLSGGYGNGRPFVGGELRYGDILSGIDVGVAAQSYGFTRFGVLDLDARMDISEERFALSDALAPFYKLIYECDRLTPDEIARLDPDQVLDAFERYAFHPHWGPVINYADTLAGDRAIFLGGNFSWLRSLRARGASRSASDLPPGLLFFGGVGRVRSHQAASVGGAASHTTGSATAYTLGLAWQDATPYRVDVPRPPIPGLDPEGREGRGEKDTWFGRWRRRIGGEITPPNGLGRHWAGDVFLVWRHEPQPYGPKVLNGGTLSVQEAFRKFVEYRVTAGAGSDGKLFLRLDWNHNF
jgi:hypothetical protein